MKEFFPNVPKIKYEGKGGPSLSFKFYNPDEKLGGKTMKEHLKFAMSYWHTLCNNALDLFGPGTLDKTFGGSNDTDPDSRQLYLLFRGGTYRR